MAVASTTIELDPCLYRQLHRSAAHALERERPGHLLEAADLVHDAYLRIVCSCQGVRFESRGHYIAIAARTIIRQLVDRARAARAQKANGGVRVEIGSDLAHVYDDPRVRYEVGEALARLAQFEPRLHLVVKLHFFAGLSFDETAAALAISVRTVKRDWMAARKWLCAHLTDSRARKRYRRHATRSIRPIANI